MNFATRIEKTHLYLLAILASAAVIGIYAYTVFPMSLNIPYRDDFQDILIFVVGFSQADKLSDAVPIIMHQHADHLTLSSRIFYYLTYRVQGEVDFRTLTYVSHLGLVALAWLFYLQIGCESRYKPLFLVCLILLLFHPRAAGLIIWPMATFQYYFIYVYFLASLYLLSSGGRGRFTAAVLAAALASFTMSVGQLTWIFGLVAIYGRRREAGFPFGFYLTAWLIASAVVLTVYHTWFEPGAHTRDMIMYSLDRPLMAAQVFFGILGSAVGMGNMLLSQVFGVVALAGSVAFLVRGMKTGLSPLHLLLVFSLLSIGMIAVGRLLVAAAFQLPLEEMALKPRYAFFSMMLWITILVLLVNQLHLVDVKKLVVLVALCAAFNIGIYRIFEPALREHRRDRIDYFNKFGLSLGPEWPTRPTLKKAAELGIYTPPERPYRPD
jgi:hypothetical protein